MLLRRFPFVFLLVGLWALGSVPLAQAASRPNILWFVVDDMSAHFSCYGETTIETPAVDRLAASGTRFTKAHVTAPVCSTCRSAFLTGMYQWSVGLHHHRSGRDLARLRLPEGVRPLPRLFRDAGYYTCNGSGILGAKGKQQRTKTDYNFEGAKGLYDGVDWAGRSPDQPFFMQVQLAGGKLRGADATSFSRIMARAKAELGNSVDSSAVRLPRYYPRDSVLVTDWTAYLESVRLTDHHVGQVVDRLKNEGIYENTLIIFMTDHGISHARGKQFLTLEGTHVPFIVSGPNVAQGVVRDDLIEHIDMAAVSLAAAGIDIPDRMQAQDVLSANYRPRRAAFAGRDRCDETVEFMRSVRSEGLLYIRNYNPFRPHLQPSRYKDGKAIVQRLRELYAKGGLDSVQERLLFSRVRPGEELYDTQSDPDETENLANHPDFREKLQSMREILDRKILATRDAGFLPEPFMSDIAMNPSQTIYDFVQADKNYPLDKILGVANMAIKRDPSYLPEFRDALSHPNAIVRYWGMVGLRVLEEDAAVTKAEGAKYLKDPDASVRIAAASVLANHGQARRAFDFLLQEAKNATTDAHALWALDGIKFLDQPDWFSQVGRSEVVKGEYSGRTFDFLIAGGVVYPD